LSASGGASLPGWTKAISICPPSCVSCAATNKRSRSLVGRSMLRPATLQVETPPS
jgi:hypothetical protein